MAALEVARGRLEESDALRESLAGAAAAQLGAELDPGPLEVGFWPARLHLESAVLVLSGGVRLELPPTRVEIDPMPLLRGVASVRGLEVHGGARLRHRDGELAGTVAARVSPAAAASAPGWVVDGEVALDSGGRLVARGSLGPGGRFAGTVEVEDVESAPFASFLSAGGSPDGGTKLAGRYGGRLETPDVGPATLRLTSADAVLDVPPLHVDGPVTLVAELPIALASDPRAGRFAIDASQADVEYAGGVAKASGHGASLTGGIAREPDGRLRLEDVRLKVTRFEGQVQQQAE